MAAWKQNLGRFALIKTGTLPSPVQSALTKLNAMTNEERVALNQKFVADNQPKIEAMWAMGSCSKEAVMDFVKNMCPFT
jgi:hypothetical protein